MDKAMSEREAFEAEQKRQNPRYSQSDDSIADRTAWLNWTAACKWQRDRDAEICTSYANETPFGFMSRGAANDCAAAILNQGSKE